MPQKKPVHALMNQFSIENGQIQLAGKSVFEHAESISGTPFYLYDSNVIIHQVNTLKTQFTGNIKIHYAVKANPLQAVINMLAIHCDGLDVASKGELMRAIASGMEPLNISFAGPGKSDDDLKAALTHGIIINVESEYELSRIKDFATSLQMTANICLRVNPDFELKSSGMKMSGGGKPFGIDAEKIPAILQGLSHPYIDFYGFHIFSGSQSLNADHLIEAQNKTLDLALELSQFAPQAVRKLNIGGGFGIPYFPGEHHLDTQKIADSLLTRLADIRQKLPQAEIILELGRYLVGPAGIYVCEVIERKVSRDKVFLITNGGLHHHLSASGNFGQIIRKNYPVSLITKQPQTSTEIVTVVGPLCTPLDIISDNIQLPVAAPGDLVVVYQSGAYGFTASPINFLSHPLAKEMLV